MRRITAYYKEMLRNTCESQSVKAEEPKWNPDQALPISGWG